MVTLKRTTKERIFNTLMIWTIISSVFAWLPLVRIVGRPNEYNWGILGLKGEGTDGPFWVFILSSVFVISMLYSAFRAPRKIFYPLLLIWHFMVAIVVVRGLTMLGTEATIQGQGLHWEFPLWIIGIPAVFFLLLALAWVMADLKSPMGFETQKWTISNTRKLVVSFILLCMALFLFRLGTNYNWVTAMAIVTTVVQWILMVESFQSKKVQKN